MGHQNRLAIRGVLGRQIHGGCCCGLPSPWEAWSSPLPLIGVASGATGDMVVGQNPGTQTVP